MWGRLVVHMDRVAPSMLKVRKLFTLLLNYTRYTSRAAGIGMWAYAYVELHHDSYINHWLTTRPDVFAGHPPPWRMAQEGCFCFLRPRVSKN